MKACHIRRVTGDEEFSNETILKVYEANIKKYGILTCYLCFKPIVDNNDSIDHAIPTTRGGGNNIENLGIAHQSCNNKKNTMTLEEWFKKTKKIIN